MLPVRLGQSGTSGTKAEIGQKRRQTLMNTGFEQSSRTGTGKHGGVKVESVPQLLRAFEGWIRLQGFSKNSPKDHRQKVMRFFTFAADRGLVDQRGRIELTTIDQEVIADYQAFLFETVSEKTGKKLSTTSQINYLSYLETFYRFLKTSKRIVIDPTEIIRLPRHPKLLPAVLLDPKEVRRLLAQPNLHNPLGFRDRVIFEVFWSTGMRVSELIGLEVADVRFEEGLITLRAPKGRKDRSVPVGEGALAWLYEYIEQVRPMLAKGGNDPHLFLNRHARGMDKTGIFHKLKLYRRRAGIRKPIGTHTFRHTLATEMLKAGADLRHIQEMLGHDNLHTTQRYLHIVKAELKKVHGRTHPREVNPSLPAHYRGSRE
jgi:integrase/recombinase XerD